MPLVRPWPLPAPAPQTQNITGTNTQVNLGIPAVAVPARWLLGAALCPGSDCGGDRRQPRRSRGKYRGGRR
jgi:hypothetical protein